LLTIKALDGHEVDVDENAIVLVAGPYPHDVGPLSYVHGVARGVLVSPESPDALVARLGVNPPLAKLTRPDLTPVWVKASAVTSLRTPLAAEQQEKANTIVQVGPISQSVHEDLSTVRVIITAHLNINITVVGDTSDEWASSPASPHKRGEHPTETGALEERRQDGKPVSAFISYSHKDDRLRAELETHLKLLQRQRLLDVWTDRRIAPGSEWGGEIDENLQASELVLFLVSPDFVASDYCYDREMLTALQRHESGLARVIPIIVRDVDWHSAPFGKLQALPKDGRAIGRGNKSARDTMWRQVAEEIRRLITSDRLVAHEPLKR
jgi:TIR domain